MPELTAPQAPSHGGDQDRGDRGDPTSERAQEALASFELRVRQAWSTGELQGLTLADYRGGVPEVDALGEGLRMLKVRAVMLRGRRQFQLVWRLPTRDLTQNLDEAQFWPALSRWAGSSRFRNAHLYTPQAEVQLAWSKKGRASLRVGAAPVCAPGEDGSTPALAHNRDKQRWVDVGQAFLRELGVTDAQARVLPTMSRKWKQINKFIEVLDAACERAELSSGAVKVVDFGCGKAYLTFAVHDWLARRDGCTPEVIGVELREDLVQQGQDIVARLGLSGMRVVQGDVRAWPVSQMDVMIALHACDTATDHAIRLGVRAQARVILCSPCCHKEVRPQLLIPHPLQPILRHGVHLGQQAEMLTDGLRAMLLEAAGYETQVFEFISLEHTNKNKMILGVRRSAPKPVAEILDQIRSLKQFYGLREQTLENLLREDGLLRDGL